MSLTLRRIIYYFFCICFAIITPVIILYASGYSLDFDHLFTPLAVQKTGMTMINSTPAGASILLNNKEADYFTNNVLKNFIPQKRNSIKTPARIKDLLPGAYDLKVELAGYFPWTRRIEIFPGKITHILDINLFKDSSPKKITSSILQEIILSPNNKKVFLPLSGEILDIKLEKTEKIGNLNFSTTSPSSWSADSNRLAWDKNIINFKNQTKNTQLNKVIGADITNLKWDDELDKIYYQFKNSINIFDLSNEKNQNITNDSNILDYEVRNKYLYYAVNNGLNAKLKIFSINDKKIVKEIDLPFSDGYRLINSGSKYINLYDSKYQTLYLIDQNVTAATPQVETIKGVKKTEWVNDKEMVWANDYEIWVLDLSKNEKKLIARWSLPIKSIIKTKAENYILFSTEKNINVITWTSGDEIQVTELASFDSISKPVFDDTEKNLYFTASANNESALYQLNIQ